MGDALSILATAIGIIGLAGGAVGYFAKSRGDSIIKYQADEIELRDGTIARLKEELAATQRERDTLKEQNTTLAGLAQGSPQLTELAKQIKRLVEVVDPRHNKSR